MFTRKAYASLAEWKRVSNGGTAALIEGARRVGKSTVAEAFAQAEYEDYLLLDFSQESEAVKRNFRENTDNLDTFFRNLFLLKGKRLNPGVSVIILDEVQLFPLARQAVKWLVADGRYHYIETGSLISIKQNTENILIPSEEHRIKMYPMDFEEFLWAKGDTITAGAIRDAFEHKRPLGDDIHRAIMRTFREYLAVGGMPQAVAAFVEGRTFEEIDFVKRSILSLYEEDLHKYDSEQNGRVSAIFNTVSEQLGSQSMRFKFSVAIRLSTIVSTTSCSFRALWVCITGSGQALPVISILTMLPFLLIQYVYFIILRHPYVSMEEISRRARRAAATSSSVVNREKEKRTAPRRSVWSSSCMSGAQ